jgi:hypothetical protein
VATIGHYLLWFVVVVALWNGLSRLLFSRRVAEVHQRTQPKAARLAKIMGLGTLLGIAGYVGLLYFRKPENNWALVLAPLGFLLLSAGDFFAKARPTNFQVRILLARLFGVLYLGLAAGSYLMLSRV